MSQLLVDFLSDATPDDIKGLPKHPEDIISQAQRWRSYEALNSMYELHKDKPYTWLEPNCYAIFGERKDGKTLIATYLARVLRACGWEVVSNLGLLFGKKITTPEEFVKIVTQVRPHTCILIDEIHMYVNRLQTNRTISVEFYKDLAAIRKQHFVLIGVSQQEESVANPFIRECKWAGYPKPWYPNHKSVGRGSQTWNYPPYSYKILERYFNPGRHGKTIREMAGTVDRRKKMYKGSPLKMEPVDLYDASCLYYSFASIPSRRQSHADAKRINAVINQLENGIVEGEVVNRDDAPEWSDTDVKGQQLQVLEMLWHNVTVTRPSRKWQGRWSSLDTIDTATRINEEAKRLNVDGVDSLSVKAMCQELGLTGGQGVAINDIPTVIERLKNELQHSVP